MKIRYLVLMLALAVLMAGAATYMQSAKAADSGKKPINFTLTDTAGKSMCAGRQNRNQARLRMPPSAGEGRCWNCPA